MTGSFLAAEALLPARNQMAISLGSHIVLACFGMALPAMIFVLHRRGLAGDLDALELAKRWSKVSGVLFALGAPPVAAHRAAAIRGSCRARTAPRWPFCRPASSRPQADQAGGKIDDAAGSPATLVGLLIVTGLAAIIVVPALTYLYILAYILADSNKVG